MATPVWKETLIPGSMLDPKTGRKFTITKRHVRQAHENIQRMLSRGVPIPCVTEHVDLEAGDPDEWRAAYARHCFGHVGDSRVTATGALELRHDVVDPDDLKILRRCKFVSPKLRPSGWMDSRGGTYEGTVLTHSAVTPSPVQYWQKPFDLSAADAFYLSYTPPEPDAVATLFDEIEESAAAPETGVCPPYGQEVGDWLDGLELSATEHPEDTPEVAPVAEEKPEKTEKPDESEGGDFAALVKALKAKGMTISDRVKDLAGLIIAVESSGAAAPEPESEPEEPANPDEQTTEAGGPPMVMSTLDKNPAARKQAVEWAKDERAEATRRINAALAGDGKKGRDPRAARQLLRQVGAVEMSFTDGAPTGKRWERLAADIAAYEKTAPAVRLTGDAGLDLSATAEVAGPKLGAAITPERAQVGCDVILGKKSVRDA